MNPSLIKQFEFEHWANKIIIESIQKASGPDERVFQLLSHLVNVHAITLLQIKGAKPGFKSWDLLTLEQASQRVKDNLEDWTDYLLTASAVDLDRFLQFKFYDKPSKITINDMIIHLINHSSYHRGQIIARLKGKLEPLPLTTYIAFARTDA